MPTYTATCYLPTVRATYEIQAETGEHALRLARALAEHDPSLALHWYPDNLFDDIEAIKIDGADAATGVCWRTDALRVRSTAPELVEVLTDLLDQTDSLAGGSSCIDDDIKLGEPYQRAVAAGAMARFAPE
jgi:hypothetical protein